MDNSAVAEAITVDGILHWLVVSVGINAQTVYFVMTEIYKGWKFKIPLSKYNKACIGWITVTLVGLCTDICVVSNAILIKAYLPEIPVQVIASCCAGVTPKSHEAALTTMKMCQYYEKMLDSGNEVPDTTEKMPDSEQKRTILKTKFGWLTR